MKFFVRKINLVLLLISFTFTLFAQKQNNTVQNFDPPFKSKISNKKNDLEIRAAIKDSGLRIETFRGSFSITLKKYNLSKEQIEINFNKYLGLSAYNSFQKMNERTDDLGVTHINYQQLYKSIPVDGAIVMLHLKNGKPDNMNGHIATIQNLITTASINSSKALQLAKRVTNTTTLSATYPIDLLIAQIPSENGFIQKLAFKVRIDASKPFTMCNVFVDAITGQIVNKVSLINNADVPATANTLYSGTQAITTDSYAGGFRLRDNARKIETYDATNATFDDVTGFMGQADFSNATTTWATVSTLNSFTINSIAQNWWYIPIVDEEPDLYIVVKNASGQIVYTSFLSDNINPPVTFSNLNIALTNSPYTIEIWDYDDIDDDDFGGSYIVSSTLGTQPWSGNGNGGNYTIAALGNPALDVHWGMEKTYDFYKNIFGRNSFDGSGSTIKNFLNPYFLQSSQDSDPNNAFALPSPYNVMCYGLGDGSFLNPVVSLDVAGHEYSHLVIENNGLGGLDYQSESGALNESFADIFGTCIEFYSRPASANWLLGEGVMVAAPNLRSMSNPDQGFEPQPDTYQGTYWVNTNSPDDNGGVHTNSGVQNYWFYLLSQGGTGTNDLGNPFAVTGIGIDQARQIAYRNLTTYIGGANATFYDSYLGSLQAAADLYGNPSAQYTAVDDAWYAVGIGNDPVNFCSGTTSLTAATGTFTDGSGASNQYANNADCSWLIQPPGASSITLSFTDFDTEFGYDGIIVYDGPDASSPVLGEFTGTTIPAPVTSTGGSMFVLFLSDEALRADGWTANYTSSSSNIYTFTGNGNWNVPSNWSNNTIPPNPLTAGTIFIDHAAGGNCILNINQTISQPAMLTVKTGKNLLIKGALTVQQ